MTKTEIKRFTSWLGKRSYRARLDRLGIERLREIARENGMKVGFLRPIIVWPFPDGEVLKVAEKVRTLLACELNIDGQLSREVARAARGKAEVHHFGSGGVEPHLPDQIFSEIRRLYG